MYCAEFVMRNAIPLGTALTTYSHCIENSNKLTFLPLVSN